MTGTCDACRFFARHRRHDLDLGTDVNLTTGDCRRSPPRARVSMGHKPLPAVWPLVAKTDFCGEFRDVDSGRPA